MDNKIKSFGIISLILIMIVTVMGVATTAVYYMATANMYRNVNLIIIFLFALLLCIIIFAVISMYFTYKGKANKVFYFFAEKGMRVLFSLYEMVASIFGLKKDEIRWVYIQLNNIIVENNPKKYGKEDVLIILPHCIQNAQCELKVTYDINKCKMCGKCSVGDVADITQKYGLNALIVTGGTAARNAVKKYKPKFIFSVACERDLSAGISDVNTIPVIGIINKRPNGPCYNTTFDTQELRAAIARFVEDCNE